ncbi:MULTISPECIES: hypothetical protein [Candidatus Accumulibacter]|uniref:Uncharacterized protein n=1 Tax=Candidatus Accumulibacter cognatus TaxID=2954383 RepID=A0A7D5SCI8_9PROT|nr:MULTISPECIES: hypothetical protein [Candidatus Accumulibacter]MCM8620207.1 hypothetical protein [Accumulibacter sp.]QLH49299.1 MAG: hypothetical protein HWD57_05500 [Candidatus Accumulibacter cognatus]
MSINLSKTSSGNSGGTAAQTVSGSPTPLQPVADPVAALRNRIAARVFGGYCDSVLRGELIQQGISDFGLEPAKAALLTDVALEGLGCANEQKLCDELTDLLRRFTDQDKKLDPKERSDAIQMVCKPRFGYSKGLELKVADALVVNFCRANGVRVKVGLLRWTIP